MSMWQQTQSPNGSETEWIRVNARQLVDDGNSSMKDHKISEAIDKYEQAIKVRPYYAVPHYNKRIALSMQNNIPSNTVKSKDSNLASQVNPYFVTNIIAAVPEYNFNVDSSDEEPDEKFSELHNNDDWPFTTTRHKKTLKLQTDESKIFELKCSYYTNHDTADSKVVDPLLSKLLANGFEMDDKDKLKTIAVSIGLNRMYSLSTRKNNSLILELESQVNTTKIKYVKFGYYWKCSWYSKNGEEANIADVRKFYKQLKNKNLGLAKKFIEQEEKKGGECHVPYRDIREYAKNHPKTKELIKAFRDYNNNAMLYLHLVDADVLDFNGVYSAYLRIIDGCYKPPTVMTTGYEFPKGTQNNAYSLLGHMERMIRVITTFHIPLGTYYPEPNMCILIPQGCDTIKESFISNYRQGKSLESPILLENIQNNRQNVYAIFSEDNPIITNIPSRAKLNKQTKQSIQFSSEFYTGPAAPTCDDIKKYDKVSQSHSDNLIWSKNIFINKSITYDNNNECDGEPIYGKNNKPLNSVPNQCIRLISNIRNNVDVELSQSKLARRIISGEDNSKNIVLAIKAKKQFQKDFNAEYERSKEEQEFIDFLEKRKVSYNNLSPESLLRIVTSKIMRLIKGKKINIQCLVDLDEEIIECISKSDQLIEALVDKEVDLDDLKHLTREGYLEDFSTACDKTYDHGSSVKDLVKLCKEDPLHLQFKANDPWDIVYTNSDNDHIVNFAIKHRYIDDDDINSISEELLGGREDSAANQGFHAILENILSERKHEQELADEEKISKLLSDLDIFA